jgi:hypothetical protein
MNTCTTKSAHSVVTAVHYIIMSDASSLFLASPLGRFRRKAQTFTGWPNFKVVQSGSTVSTLTLVWWKFMCYYSSMSIQGCLFWRRDDFYMFENPESWMRTKKTSCTATQYRFKKRGGGSEPSDSTWELASDLGSSSPTPSPPVQWLWAHSRLWRFL